MPEGHDSDVNFTGISSCGGDLCCDWLPSLSKCLPLSFCLSYCDNHIFQAAKALGSSHSSSQRTLAELFQRIEKFIRRLESYAKVTPTPELQEVIVNVMAEVLSVLAIATAVIARGKAGEVVFCVEVPLLAYAVYLKKRS
jgi:hypothetical protein